MNPINILTLEGKDVYLYMTATRKAQFGVNLRDKDNNLMFNKFVNTLDDSLDMRYLKMIMPKDFIFKVNNKYYSRHIVNLDFNLSVLSYNQFYGNMYVKFGYLSDDLVFEDNICIIDDELVGIIINKNVENPRLDCLNKYFIYNCDKKIYERSTRMFSKVAPTKDIKRFLYTNDFIIDGLNFTRFKRSSGASRKGKCMFIYKDIYEKFCKWEISGLNIKANDEIDLAAFESYRALSASSIIGSVTIPKENILIVDDYFSNFSEDAVKVSVEDSKLVSNIGKCDISNSIWDGMSLGDSSLFKGKYKNKGMLLLRNKTMFKSCMFNTNIQKFFKDKGITDIKQLSGFTLAKNISDIKLITTKSSIKYMKFANSYMDWFNNYSSLFGIVKYEKPTKFANKVKTHYQLLNTLNFNMENMDDFMQDNISLLKKLRDDIVFFKSYLKMEKTDDKRFLHINTINDMICELIDSNPDFEYTKIFNKFRNDKIKSLVNGYRMGNVFVNGNYSVLCGNPIEMLYFSIGQFDGTARTLVDNEIYNTNFKFGIDILGSRSPHITIGNIFLAVNKFNKEIETYMKTTREIVYINSIKSNVLQRLNGADFDSDTMLLTDNSLLIKLAMDIIHLYKVPTAFIDYLSIKRRYNHEELAELDIRTSVNKIGEIVNLSQYLNSLLWHNINRNIEFDIDELYKDICKLSVLSGIEIDRAKKEFEIDTSYELTSLRLKYNIKENNMTVKPMFFKRITLNNGYKLNDNICYKYFDTSMDYIQKVINKHLYKFYTKSNKDNILSISDIIKNRDYKTKDINYRQKKEIEAILRELQNKFLYKNKFKSYKSKAIYENEKAICIKKIMNYKINNATAFYIIKDNDWNNESFLVLMQIPIFSMLIV